MALHLLLCREDGDELLRADLHRRGLRVQPLAPGVVAFEGPLAPRSAFARQVMPECRTLALPSIQKGAEALGLALDEALPAGSTAPFRLHVLACGAASAGRARLLEEALDGWLAKARRTLRRRRVAEGPWRQDETLVQLLLTSNDQALLSVATPAQRHALGGALSAFPGGAVEQERDERPPSRAYQKLREAHLRMGRPVQAGETLVDLGACPGGWTFDALQAGAHVTGIDRSPLRDDLMRHRHFTFVKGDAFAWHPERPVDWLVCDLIAFPERTLALLEDWLGGGRCRRFVVTVKFRGSEDHGRVDEVEALLRRHAVRWSLLRLDANKNEVTAMGEVRGAKPKAVVFDLDGVLLHSREAWFRAVQDGVAHFGGGELKRADFDLTFGQGADADVAQWKLGCTPHELDRFYAAAFLNHLDHSRTDPDALAMLAALKGSGLRLALATNTVSTLALPLIAAAGIAPFMEVPGCADQVAHGKPAPDLLLSVAKRLDLPVSACWMVGDSRYDREAAHAAGMHFIGRGIDGDQRIESLAELPGLVG